ncbi:MAG: hypothetical protein RDV48_15545 [Candidatus Eremiobacteraeota bacterium]|nr:hypothetical protein [Candidatus Eremiobacteraeota bacterium]
MTREQYLDLLRNADNPDSGEYPPGFDREGAEKKFIKLAGKVEELLATKCFSETGVYIQDASFHGEIVVPREFWNADGDGIFIRVSNFGGFATVGCYSAEVPEKHLSLLIPVLEEMGYVYIPENILYELYTGGLPFREQGASWWLRYFDYL